MRAWRRAASALLAGGVLAAAAAHDATPVAARPAAVPASAASAASAAVAAPAPLAPPAPSAASAALAADAPRVCPPPVDRSEAAVAADRGLLWRATRDGRSSYLFATLHVGRPAWRAFGPRTAAALRETDTLALEIDPADPAVAAALSLMPNALSLPAELARRLARATERACLPPAALSMLHPVLQATTLTLLDARWLGLDATYAMEMLLAERVRAAGRRVVSLESAEMQQSALVPADAAEATSMVEQALAQLEDQTTRRVLARLATAWEQGDLAALESYETWCECADSDEDRAFLRRLNDDRNPHLAAAIAELHAQGRRVFAAVGALHMTGPQALPALLAARGFRVERIVFGPRPRP